MQINFENVNVIEAELIHNYILNILCTPVMNVISQLHYDIQNIKL